MIETTPVPTTSRVSAARYRPREYLVSGFTFGGSPSVPMKPTESIREAARARAALRQSDMSFQIRQRMHDENVPMASVARIMGTTYDHLGKVLRGHVIMTLEDYELAIIVLDGYKDSAERKARRSVFEQKQRAR
jgi:hypothetical protein